MWEVKATSPITGRERELVTDSLEAAKQFAVRAAEKKWRVLVIPIYTDIIIADAVTGDFVVFRKKVAPGHAVSFYLTWIKTDRQSGCMLWPHGKPFPASFKPIHLKEKIND